MTIHAETLGAGPDVVMLHGWGMHGGIWRDLAQQLAGDYRVTLFDLPGHGRSGSFTQKYSIENVAACIADHAPPRAHWIGWSLGGLIAQHVAATQANRVSRLVLVASTPRFVRGTDWPDAMDADILAQFGTALAADYRATLQRFLALEVQDSVAARNELRELRARVFAHGDPHPEALRGGLEILRSADLRPHYAALGQRVLALFGQRDNLVPAAVGPALKTLLPRTQLRTLLGAAHAPFLSQSATCAEVIREFLNEP